MRELATVAGSSTIPTRRSVMSQAARKIVPHLWFDKQAKEAADFYVSVFPESRVVHTTVIPSTPSGDCDLVTFDVWGQRFMAISAGPDFRINPSISFLVNFDPVRFGDEATRESAARTSLDDIWAKLSEGGQALMPLDEYPFSRHYGWMQDRYGVSWQLMLTDPKGEPRPPVLPFLLFAGKRAGTAEEAIRFYTSLFGNSGMGEVVRHPSGPGPDKEGTVMFADFRIGSQWFAAMDSAHEHQFDFNEAVSLLVNCDSQEEIDRYWKELSSVPASEQCGWLKDRFGVSWQISTARMEKMFETGSPEQIRRVTEAFLRMKKLDVAKLEAAFSG
jgi:predicted 3-demethylubiquinone-9 3-methyltransferase (glyoxalase superfamily)